MFVKLGGLKNTMDRDSASSTQNPANGKCWLFASRRQSLGVFKYGEHMVSRCLPGIEKAGPMEKTAFDFYGKYLGPIDPTKHTAWAVGMIV